MQLLRCSLAYLRQADSEHLPTRALALWGAFHSLVDAYVAREDGLDGPLLLGAMREDSWLHAPHLRVPPGTQRVAPDTWHVHVTHLFARAAWLCGALALQASRQLQHGALPPRSQQCLGTVQLLQRVELALTLYSAMRDTPLCAPEHATAPCVRAPSDPASPLSAAAMQFGGGALGSLGHTAVTASQEGLWRTRTHLLLSCLEHCAAVVHLSCLRCAGGQVTVDLSTAETALGAAATAVSSGDAPGVLQSLLSAASEVAGSLVWAHSLWVLPPALWHVAQLAAKCLRQMGHLLVRAPQHTIGSNDQRVAAASFALQRAALRAMHCAWVLSVTHSTRGRKGRGGAQTEQLWTLHTVQTHTGQATCVGPVAANDGAPLSVSLAGSRGGSVSKAAAAALLDSAYRVTAAHCKALQAATAAACAAAHTPSEAHASAAREALQASQVLRLHTPGAAAGRSVASPLPSPVPDTPGTAGAGSESPAVLKALTSVWPPAGAAGVAGDVCLMLPAVLLEMGSGRHLLCAPCSLPGGGARVYPLQAIQGGVLLPVKPQDALHGAVLDAQGSGLDMGAETRIQMPGEGAAAPPTPPPVAALTLLADVVSALHACRYLLGSAGTEARLMRKQVQLLALLTPLQHVAWGGVSAQSAPADAVPPGTKRPRSEVDGEHSGAAAPKAARGGGGLRIEGGGEGPATLPDCGLLCVPANLQSALQPLDGILNSQKSLRNNQLVSVWHAEAPHRSRDWHLAAGLASLHLPAHAPSDALAYGSSEDPLSTTVPDCYLHLDRRVRTYEMRRCSALHTVTGTLAAQLGAACLGWPWRPYSDLGVTPQQHQYVPAVELLLDVGGRLVAPQEGTTCVTLPAATRVLALLLALLAPQEAAHVWSQRGGAQVPASAVSSTQRARDSLPPGVLQRAAALAGQLARGWVLGLRGAKRRGAAYETLVSSSPEAAGVLSDILARVQIASGAAAEGE